MRAGWLDEPVPGVLVIRGGPPTWEQRLMVVGLAAGNHGVASYRSAARTLCDLGSVVHDQRQVQRALTSARRRGIDLLGVRAIAERLHRPHQSGTGTLLSLLAAVPWEGTLPETWFEELLALCLDDRSLPPMALQHPIVDAAGRIVARTAHQRREGPSTGRHGATISASKPSASSR